MDVSGLLEVDSSSFTVSDDLNPENPVEFAKVSDVEMRAEIFFELLDPDDVLCSDAHVVDVDNHRHDNLLCLRVTKNVEALVRRGLRELQLFDHYFIKLLLPLPSRLF